MELLVANRVSAKSKAGGIFNCFSVGGIYTLFNTFVSSGGVAGFFNKGDVQNSYFNSETISTGDYHLKLVIHLVVL